MLMAIFSVLIMFFSINAFENFLVTYLFKAEKPDGSTWNDAYKYQSTGQEIDDNRLSCCRQLCHSCLRQNKYERIFNVARKKLEKEFNIVRVIKHLREHRTAFKMNTAWTEDQRVVLKNAQFKLLTLDLYKDSEGEDESEASEEKMKRLQHHEVHAYGLFRKKSKRTYNVTDSAKPS